VYIDTLRIYRLNDTWRVSCQVYFETFFELNSVKNSIFNVNKIYILKITTILKDFVAAEALLNCIYF